MMPKPTKSTKSTKSISSYILDNQKSELVPFALDEINKSTYFRVRTLRKIYITKNIIIEKNNISDTFRRGISIKIGKIVSELNRLKLVTKYTSAIWKNLYKGNLYAKLDEKLEQNYIIKIKIP